MTAFPTDVAVKTEFVKEDVSICAVAMYALDVEELVVIASVTTAYETKALPLEELLIIAVEIDVEFNVETSIFAFET